MSVNYYNQQAATYYSATVDVDMQPVYQRFLPYLPEGGHILDAGCGSGRDAKKFMDLGFKVTAFDASKELVNLAKQHSGLAIKHSTFIDFSTATPVNGIWACASLLHLPLSELAATLNHLAKFLVEGGAFYCSFKYGQNEISRDGRHFTNLDETQLEQLIKNLPLTLAEYWISGDLRPGREQEAWLNAVLIKENQ